MQSTTDHTEQKIVARVRALLAKAESTTFPEEADALIAKAQELMTRYAIDGAVLRAAATADEKPALRVVNIERPYVSAKQTLLACVARANGVAAVLSYERVTLVGFERDLEATEIIYTSLLLQATAAMRRVPADEVVVGTRAFRHAFLIGFAYRVQERLLAVREQVEADAADEHGAALVPILQHRKSAVDDAVAEAFPRLGTKRAASISDYGGVSAGAAAANRADLGGRGRVGGSRGSLC